MSARCAVLIGLCVAHAARAFFVGAAAGGAASSSRLQSASGVRAPFRGLTMHGAPPISSPFDAGQTGTKEKGSQKLVGPLPLTLANVEAVLDEMRPYLLADGGNVAVREIEGPNVYLELEGACGSCPSSSMTMKMGLERGLREKIPEITNVVQVPSEGGESLSADAVEAVLEEVRPFLQMAGGSIELKSLSTSGIAPTATLLMLGEGAALTSVKVEIQQRLKRKLPALVNVMWE
ncbi:hypothetical protein KFE25_008412 [Diacronema lutheri]|uniref:NIF system FeS cluster assembly NifU C-terminal domain-containing protein n=1 Tax=Diacronema lutheri TaxID=2081491 RepID=A0A8J6C604_DIALT|nr:hypothetical protein KFE25_008412 [Diacronema lutheri]